jgi:hypothetical protein
MLNIQIVQVSLQKQESCILAKFDYWAPAYAGAIISILSNHSRRDK